jgi:hypothetical protein
MTVTTAGTLLVLFLPFLLSLAGQAGQPKMLCLVTSLLALLLSFDPYRATLPWAVGMAISVISVRESFYQRRGKATAKNLKKKTRRGCSRRVPLS